MPASKAERNRQQAPAIARYQAKAYRKYTFRVRYDGAGGFVPADLEAAAGESVNAWIVEAIRQRLERESRADGP